MDWQLIKLKQVDSTMTLAKRLMTHAGANGIVVIAEVQTKGRGRFEREWISPPGGLYMSLGFKPHFPQKRISLLTLAGAVSVSEAVKTIINIETQIKWPNDLLVMRKSFDSAQDNPFQTAGLKVCGILTESDVSSDKINFIVMGIGLNINIDQSLLPENAASLHMVKGEPVKNEGLIHAILQRMEYWLGSLNQGHEELIKKWKELSCTLGRHVKISQTKGIIEGEAIDIDDSGALLVRMKDKTVVKVLSGEITVN